MVAQVNNLRLSLAFTLKHEGGYVNNPNDRGGETNWGISKKNHPNEDIKNMTPERASDIYAQDYWMPAGCDALPYPYCAVVFDTAVLHGPGKATFWLKQAENIRQYLNLRRMWYYQRVKENPSQNAFLAGWLSRVNDLGKLVDIALENPMQDQMASKWGGLG